MPHILSGTGRGGDDDTHHPGRGPLVSESWYRPVSPLPPTCHLSHLIFFLFNRSTAPSPLHPLFHFHHCQPNLICTTAQTRTWGKSLKGKPQGPAFWAVKHWFREKNIFPPAQMACKPLFRPISLFPSPSTAITGRVKVLRTETARLRLHNLNVLFDLQKTNLYWMPILHKQSSVQGTAGVPSLFTQGAYDWRRGAGGGRVRST